MSYPRITWYSSSFNYTTGRQLSVLSLEFERCSATLNIANWPYHLVKEAKVEKVVGGAVVDLPVAVLETYQSWEEVVRRDLGGRLVNVSAL